jgi:hypothetical protein
MSDDYGLTVVLTVNGVVRPDAEQLVKTWAGTKTTDLIGVSIQRDARPITYSTGAPGRHMAETWHQSRYWAARLRDSAERAEAVA